MAQETLSRATLGRMDRRVAVPRFDLAAVKPGIVHLGFGGFHRAHMARYTHNLMQIDPGALAWGIVGAGLLATDRRMYEALTPQDGLYTLTERDASSETVSVIGAASRLIDAGQGARAILEAVDGPEIRIVSLTITEHGYGLNPSSKRLDVDHPAVAADLAATAPPQSAVGVLTEAYKRRWKAGRPAFTAMSCDNIQNNGGVLKQAVLDFADRQHSALAEWIDRQARFPSAMVDRITPVTRPEDVTDLAERYGLADRWPVFCERFSQWVIEDQFADGRPDWDRVGAQFVDDVAPYERMKLRLLNASHLAVAGLGRLAGRQFIDQAMGDARMRRYMQLLMDHETGPTLLPVPGIDLSAYKATLVERFANPTLRDTVDRVNADAPLNYLLDPIRERTERGESVDLLSLALAAWLRRVRGVDEAGRAIPVSHPLADVLRQKALEGGKDPRPLLQISTLFGDLGGRPALVEKTAYWLASLYDAGAERTLDDAIVRYGRPSGPID